MKKKQVIKIQLDKIEATDEVSYCDSKKSTASNDSPNRLLDDVTPFKLKLIPCEIAEDSKDDLLDRFENQRENNFKKIVDKLSSFKKR